jgi:hypothetical protein
MMRDTPLYPSSFTFWMSPNIVSPGTGHLSPWAWVTLTLLLKNQLFEIEWV